MSLSRLRGKICLGIAGLVLGTSAIVGLLVARRAERDALGAEERALHAQASLLRDSAAPHLGSPPDAAFEARLRRLAEEGGARLTVLAADGRVLADSAGKRAEEAVPDGSPELHDAREAGRGVAIRLDPASRTREMALAIAVREGGEVRGFVRASRSLAEIEGRLRRLRGAVAAGAGLAAVVAIGFGAVFARRMTRSLAALTDAAEAIGAGEAGRGIGSSARDEIGTLARALDAMSRRVRERTESVRSERDEILHVLESMVEGIVAVDAAERVLLLNGVAGRMLRADPRAVRGRPIWEASRVLGVRDILRQAMDEGAERTAEIVLPAPGRDRAIALDASPLRDAKGAVAGAVLVLHDVTELRRLESVRRDFVANVSHELKTPLTAIHGLVETLLDDAAIGEAKRREYLERIRLQSERMSNLVTDLLTLSRVESGEAVLDRSPLDLRERARDSARRFLPASEAKRIRLDTAFPREPVLVLADAEAIAQVVDNLLDNAVKYTPAGGAVSLRVRRDDGRAVLEVEDTGPGIEPRDRERIFERFYRVDKARSRELGGTGLGLAIVKHVVLALGGEVSVESVPGAGSTFRVRLPLAEGSLEGALARGEQD